jgi:septal ring factor EnvC (AmiA/AmiB activator)
VQKMIAWISAHKAALGAAFGLLVLLSALWLAGAVGSLRYERREDKREEKREEIKEQETELRGAAEEGESRAEEIERERARLKSEAERLRSEIVRLKSKRKKASVSYEAGQSEIDSITDFNVRRERNCADRARLGYPCP